MKSLVIFQNRKRGNPCGFLVMEALVALTVMTLIVPAVMILSLSNEKLMQSAEARLDLFPNLVDVIENGVTRDVASSSILYQHEFGKSTCTLAPTDPTKGFATADIYNPSLFNLGSNTLGTSETARNGYVYETANPPSQSVPDFFIIDDRNPASPTIISSLVTGPGLSAVTVSGYYAYVANESSIWQLLVIDIHDRTHPFVSARLKLPLPYSTSTAPYASSIFYDDGLVYLGTQKWDSAELNIIDVSTPTAPTYAGGFETNSLVNAIYESGGYAYIATASVDKEIFVLDVRNPSAIVEVSHFSPAGSAVLEGKTFAYDSGSSTSTSTSASTLYFARDGGGFNNPNQYELFSFNLTTDFSAQNPTHFQDISGGVYGIIAENGYVFLASGSSTASFQIWKNDFSKEIYSAVLPSKPIYLSCDHDRLYVAFADSSGFAVIVPH